MWSLAKINYDGGRLRHLLQAPSPHDPSSMLIVAGPAHCCLSACLDASSNPPTTAEVAIDAGTPWRQTNRTSIGS